MEVHYSSKTDIWETPQSFFDDLNREFHFETDVCALPENAKCDKFYTPDQDGLKQDWSGVCWCNPPYGKGIEKWVEKAYKSNCTVVMLIPARTDTKWFHNWAYQKAEIRFIKGRVRFGEAKNPAPFPSMILVYRQKEGGCYG
jgi:phage N-6-adenine-methyltransferase